MAHDVLLKRILRSDIDLLSVWRSYLLKDDALSTDVDQRVRLFLLSHILGPVIGLGLVAYLVILERGPSLPLVILTATIAAFWLYPIALYRRVAFNHLSLLSLQHLTWVILFASHLYGGVSSPFFFWLLIVPLFGFFYLGDTPRMRLSIIAALVANVAGYFVIAQQLGPATERISISQTKTIYLFSVLGAGAYVMIMALAHARLLSRQAELVKNTEAQRKINEELLFAKEAAQAANRAKTEFIATTSHELRTPLNAIIGFSQLIKTQTLGPINDRYLGYIRDIEESGTHLLEIINDILDIAKADSGRIELTEEEIDVRQLIAASLRLVHGRAVKAGLSISVRVPNDGPPLRADRRRVKQTLLNLLGNAIKFTPTGGSIVVTAGVDHDGTFAIAIADSGIGIPPEKLDKVKQPFFQIDNSLARKNEGLGLGLSLASTFMERHGGKLELASELGNGTRATMRFPASRV